jgi:glutathione S-transferase
MCLTRRWPRSGHLVGDSFTLADVYVMPVLEITQRAPEGKEMVQSAKHLAAYSPNTRSGPATGHRFHRRRRGLEGALTGLCRHGLND